MNHPLRIVHVANFGFKPTKVFLHGVSAKLTNGWVRGGHHVLSFSDRDIARWVSPFGHRKLGVGQTNRILVEVCKANRPEVLALGHADIIRPETLDQIREALPDIRMLQWNVDPVFTGEGTNPDNANRIRSKQDQVDATFISSAGELLAPFAEGGRTVGFLPNPVDPSLERGRVFEQAQTPYDVFYAIGAADEARHHVGGWRVPSALVADLKAALPDVSFLLPGFKGAPTVSGPAYEDAIMACASGLNISRRNDGYLYTSDRLAHLVGNGVAAHIDRATGYGDLFGEDQFAFYSSEAELIDTIARFKREPAARQKLAEAGWGRYFDLFDTAIIAQYMLDVVNGTHDPSRYEWPTLYRPN